MDNNPVVNEELTTPQASEAKKEVEKEEESQQPAPGSKTDSELLLKSLKEEREKRRILEEELNTIKSSNPSEEVFSDEGKALKKLIDTQNEQIARLEEEKQLERVYGQFPDVKDNFEEFDEFRKEYPRHKLENVAKLFRAEKGFLEPKRKGLESATGGTRTPQTSGMTFEDLEKLRTTNWRKYKDMVMKDQIKMES